MDRFSSEQLAFEVSKEVDKIKINMSQLNMMVIGKTGVGKSTLINGMFGEDLAPTGTGFPVTLEINSYSKNNYPFVIMDWPGFELDGGNSIDEQFSSIKKTINWGIKTKKPQNMIHCILYCVSATGHRFEDAEIDFIKRLLAETGKTNIPVIMVITQAIMKSDTKLLVESIEKDELPFADIVPVLVKDVDLEDYVKKAYGLDKLAAAVGRLINDDLKNTLECVQQVNIKMMTRRATMVVNGNAAKAGALGLKPVFRNKDIYPIIVSTLAGITTVYNIEIDDRFIKAIPELIEESGGTDVRTNKVLNVIKFIEPTLYLANSAVVGTQAAAVIRALGGVFIKMMNDVSRKEITVEDINLQEFISEYEMHFKASMMRKENGEDASKSKKKRLVMKEGDSE